MMSSASPIRSAPVQPLQSVERPTLTRILFHSIDRFGSHPALRYRASDGWQSLSYEEVGTRISRLAAALSQMGIGRGDRVALLSENRPEWAISDYALLGLGAVNVPIYATLPTNQIAHILNDCSARAVLVSTAEQLEKIREIREQVPSLELVIGFEASGQEEEVRSFASLLEEGHTWMAQRQVPDFRERALAVEPDDLATLIYTSGTTGTPKGVMLSHYNLAYMVAATHQHGTLPTTPGDVSLSFLPLSHVLERIAGYYFWDSGVCIAYAESIDKVAENLMEVGPHYMVSVPRLFEKIYTRVTAASGAKGRLVQWAVGIGKAVAEAHTEGGSLSLGQRLQYRLADRLVFAKLRQRTGGRLKAIISGGAPLSEDVGKFFFAAGLPVYEGYGLTETSPVLTANRPGQVRFGTVGTPYPGVEIRIGAEGEILARTPGTMSGYWNQPELTATTIDADGWLHTGDIGEIDHEGFLRITDRLKDLIVTAGGKNIAPQPMELRVAMSPLIAQAVILGDRRPFPVLLLVPERENVLAWAAEQGIEIEPAELSAHPRVRTLLEHEAEQRLQEFARYERPKKIALLPEELTIEAGLLTPTLKVRRRAVEARYADIIEALYAEPRA